jgi:Fe-S cluster biogenesis protein NfuA
MPVSLPRASQKLNEGGRLADPIGMPSALARPLLRRVEAALDRLRPALLADGGNLELVDVDDDGTVRIQLQGACTSCPAQGVTLRYGIEAALRQEVPEVRAVVAA